MGGLIDYDDLEYQELLTNEKLKKRFSSKFDLVLYSIAIARKYVISGKSKLVEGNITSAVLTDISDSKDVDKGLIDKTRLTHKIKKESSAAQRTIASNKKKVLLSDDSVIVH